MAVPFVGGEPAASARASYKGEVDGTTYGALQGELLHHFQIKPLEAEPSAWTFTRTSLDRM